MSQQLRRLDKMLALGRVPETTKHFLEQADDDTRESRNSVNQLHTDPVLGSRGEEGAHLCGYPNSAVFAAWAVE